MATKTTKKEKGAARKSKPLPKNKIDMGTAGGKELLKQMGDAPVGKSAFYHEKINQKKELREQKQALADAEKALNLEIKRNGFSVNAANYVTKLVMMDPDEAQRKELDIAIGKEAYGLALTEQQELALGEDVASKDDAPDPDEVARKRGAAAPVESSPAEARKVVDASAFASRAAH